MWSVARQPIELMSQVPRATVVEVNETIKRIGFWCCYPIVLSCRLVDLAAAACLGAFMRPVLDLEEHGSNDRMRANRRQPEAVGTFRLDSGIESPLQRIPMSAGLAVLNNKTSDDFELKLWPPPSTRRPLHGSHLTYDEQTIW